MSDTEIQFYPKLSAIKSHFKAPSLDSKDRLEPATCKEAEPYALRVLDNSMEPEFRKGCIIVIDPTGRATDGSYVLASTAPDEEMVFRQLCKSEHGTWELYALNPDYPETTTLANLDGIMGVIVQRAGVRRKYHKHYI